MSIRIPSFFLCLILFTTDSNAQNRIQINIPTVEAETEYVWRTLRDIQFFEENNYQIGLPKGELIDSLIKKIKSGTLADGDYNELLAYMKERVYDKGDYLKGYAKIEEQQALVNQMISNITQAQFNWRFDQFDTYQVNLTLYGPGGSYDPSNGSLVIYTTTNGQFKGYSNPANTIIHEVVHMGIENSIVGAFNVPHPLKERIVDTIVSLNFKHLLPDYRIQNMGDTRIDAYLKKVEDIKNLDSHVQHIMNQN